MPFPPPAHPPAYRPPTAYGWPTSTFAPAWGAPHAPTFAPACASPRSALAPWQGPSDRHVPTAHRAETPAALYVIASFALMMILAAAMVLGGSAAAFALFDETTDDDLDAPATEVSAPSASVSVR